ncbi:MAG: nickel pincer cofactor biosynthesis protein LarC [Actinomycetota bacterium]
MRLLYFDCIAGISGDMALGALVDAGADGDTIRDRLNALPIEPFELSFEQVEADGIGATRAIVETPASEVIRTYASIRQVLDAADLPEPARALAQRIFRRLAEAEARVHNKEVELVTFHEVGAVDSIVDIVGVALALTDLGADRIFSSAVPTGMGLVRVDHGMLPIPAPAVVELLRGVPLYSRGVPVELTTPTGAAILAATVEGYGDLPSMRVDASGYGAGTRQLDFPNVLRVLLGEEATGAGARHGHGIAGPGRSREVVLETNVDDLSPELIAATVESALGAGAQDAWCTPIVMKKGRAAVTVSVLCSSELEEDLTRLLFLETGTLGVRSTPVDKRVLERRSIEVATSAGTVRVKIGVLDGRVVRTAPEYDDVARVAREGGVPARQIHDEAMRLASEALGDDSAGPGPGNGSPDGPPDRSG